VVCKGWKLLRVRDYREASRPCDSSSNGATCATAVYCAASFEKRRQCKLHICRCCSPSRQSLDECSMYCGGNMGRLVCIIRHRNLPKQTVDPTRAVSVWRNLHLWTMEPKLWQRAGRSRVLHWFAYVSEVVPVFIRCCPQAQMLVRVLHLLLWLLPFSHVALLSLYSRAGDSLDVCTSSWTASCWTC
jgi:hypothetical protein